MTEIQRGPLFPKIPEEFKGAQRKWCEDLLAFLRTHIHGDYDDFMSHSSRHENGGDDEIEVTGLTGVDNTLQGKSVDAPVAADDDMALFYDHANSKFDYASFGAGHIFLFPWFYDTIGQGTWTQISDANSVFYYYFYNTSNTDGDNLTWKAHMSPGTYTFKALYYRINNAGILDVDIDAVEVASWDAYGVAARNQLKTTTGIVVATKGVKTIKLRVDGKNASSTGYYAPFQALVFYRTV